MFKNIDIKQLEDYIFSSNDIKPKDTKLIQGTETYYYILLLDHLKSNKIIDKSSDHVYSLYQEYKKLFPESKLLKKIELRNDFLQYEQCGESLAKQKILSDITKNLLNEDILQEIKNKEKTINQRDKKLSMAQNLSHFDYKLLEIEDLMNKAINDKDSLAKLSSCALKYINITNNTPSEVVLQIACEGDLYNYHNTIIDGLNKISLLKDKQIKTTDEHTLCTKFYSNLGNIYNKCTIEQLDYWLTINPSCLNDNLFVEYYIIKKYSNELDYEIYLNKINIFITKNNAELRLKNLCKLREFIDRLPLVYWKFKKALIEEILKTRLYLEKPDIELFKKYLDDYKDEQIKLYKKNYEKCMSCELNLNSLDSMCNNPNKLKSLYLKKYFKTANGYDIFKGYFTEEYLTTKFNKTKLKYDNDMTHNERYISKLSPIHVERLLKKQILNLRFLGENAIDPKTELKFEITHKNIDKIIIKIYEIDTENYYRQYKCDIDPKMSFDFIYPNFEKQIAIDKSNFNTYKISSAMITLDELTNKTGSYIIDFCSSSIKQRIYIKREKLYFIHRYTAAGNLFMVFNSEDRSLITNKKSCIIYDNETYKSNEKGQIYVPYSEKITGEAYVLLKADDRYDIAKFIQKREEYSLECDFILDPLALIPNHEAEVLLIPKLLINNFPTAASLLKAVYVEINTTNENGIKSSIDFKDMQFTKDDLILKFVVPAKLSQVDIKLNGKIKQDTTDQFVTVEVKKTFNIKNIKEINNRHVIFSFELIKDNNNEYYLNLLGKNGENVPNIDTEIKIKHKLFKDESTQLLTTDDMGRIYLGRLEDVERLMASTMEKVTIPRIKNEWNIDDLYRNQRMFCNTIYTLQNKEIIIPYDIIENENSFKLLQVSNHGHMIIDQLDVKKFIQINKELGVVILNGLSLGKYLLINVKINERLKIKVIDGFEFSDDAILYHKSKNKIIENSYAPKKIACIHKTEFNKDEIRIQLKGYDKSTRVNIIGIPYLQNEYNYKNLQKKFINSIYLTKPIKNEQTKLGELHIRQREIDPVTVYVESRRLKPKIVGSILEKPSYILNIKPLSSEKQNSQSDQVNSNNSNINNRNSDNSISISSHKKKFTYQDMICESNSINNASKSNKKNDLRIWDDNWSKDINHNPNLKYNLTYQKTEIINDLYLKNYIKNPSKIICNLVPNEDGMVIVNKSQLDVEHYSALNIICINKYSYETCIVNLNQDIPKNDLKLKSFYDPKKCYREHKKEETILINEKALIQDVTNAEIQIVDNLEKLFKCQKEIKRIVGNKDDTENLPDGYNTWSWMSRWHELPIENKHSFYDKYSSHEVNLFLYFKDKQYFETVVRPFIANKGEKTFIDEFLLGMDLKQYAELNRIEPLNALEKCLLIKWLMENDLKKKAIAILELLEAQQGPDYNKNLEKKIFEAILRMNSLDSNIKPENKVVISHIEEIKETAKKAAINWNSQDMFLSYDAAPSMSVSSTNRALHDEINTQGRFKTLQRNMPMARNAAAPEKLDRLMRKSEQVEVASSMMYKSKSSKSKGLALFSGLGNMVSDIKSSMKMRSAAPQNEDFMIEPLESMMEDDNDELENKCAFRESSVAMVDAYYDDEDVKLAKEEVEVYVELENTKEYAEMQYYNVKYQQDYKSRVKANKFWIEYAKHLINNKDKLFVTKSFTYAISNHTEMLTVLAIMDLEFKPGYHIYKQIENRGLEVQAQSNMLIFYKEIVETTKAEEEIEENILITKRYYEPNDEFDLNKNGKKVEKYVKKFYAHKPYTCQIIITNLSSKELKAQVLYQIPQGCLPVLNENYEKVEKIRIAPYNSKTLQYSFYSPHVSKALQIPTYILKKKQAIHVTTADVFQFEDINTLEKDIKQEINDISIEYSSKETLLGLLRLFINLPETDPKRKLILSKLFNYLYNEKVYRSIIELYKDNMLYDDNLWKFGFYHFDSDAIKEYIENRLVKIPTLKMKIGYEFHTRLVEIESIKEMLNYIVVNSGSIFGNDEKNKALDQNTQYGEYLMALIEKTCIDPDELIGLAIMLIGQGRDEESIKIWKSLDKKIQKNKSSIQYDYLSVFLDTKLGYPEFKLARSICQQYLDYPIIKWRNLFKEVYDTLNRSDKISNDVDIKPNNVLTKVITLSAIIEKTKVNIYYQNISTVRIRYYLVDLEVLFSLNPFIMDESNRFDILEPNFYDDISLDSKETHKQIDISPKAIATNCMIEILDPLSKQTSSLYYFNCALRVEIYEKIGNLDVMLEDNDQPLSMVYVKAFAKMKNGTTDFYKDGYTDVSGRFDYSSISTSKFRNVEKFSIFVSHEKYGSKVMEAKPPLNQ